MTKRTLHDRYAINDKHSSTDILSESRLKLFIFIKSEIDAGRPFPTAPKLCDHMGWINIGSVRDSIAALKKRALSAIGRESENPHMKS